MQNRRTRRISQEGLCEAVTCALVFFCTLFLCYRFSLIDFDPHHTGLMYKTALDVARGGVIFRDTFTQYGALTALLQALAILLFGESVTSILFSTALFYAGSYLLFYLLARRFFGRVLALVLLFFVFVMAPFLLWTFHPWSSVYALFFMLCTLLFVLRAQKGDLCAPFLAGLFSLLGFWCRQPVGALTLFCAVLSLSLLSRCEDVENRRKRCVFSLSLCLLGALFGFLFLFVPIVANGALRDFYRQCIAGMVRFAGSRSGVEIYGPFGVLGMILYCLLWAPFDVAWADLTSYIWVLVPLVTLALFAFTLRALVRQGFVRRRAELLVLCLFSLCSWHQYYPVPCLRHWYWAAFPCFLCAVFFCAEWAAGLCGRIRGRWPFRRRVFGRRAALALALALGLLFAPNLCARLPKGVQKLAQAGERCEFYNENYTHLNGLYLRGDVALYYGELFDRVAFLKERFPHKNVVNATENGINAVFGENFCPLFNNAGDFYYAEYPALLCDYIQRERPIVIGAEPPDESYVLWVEPAGESGDAFESYHRMPARIFLPAELYEALVGGSD